MVSRIIDNKKIKVLKVLIYFDFIKNYSVQFLWIFYENYSFKVYKF